MNYPEIVKQLTLEEKIRMVTGYGAWHTYPVERLGIESIMMTDGPIGLRKVDEGKSESYVSVCFPSGCLAACSFDRDLLEKMGQALGDECQAYDVGMILGPAINIKRSPLCGRNFEYYSEDPYLTGELAASYINGSISFFSSASSLGICSRFKLLRIASYSCSMRMFSL